VKKIQNDTDHAQAHLKESMLTETITKGKKTCGKFVRIIIETNPKKIIDVNSSKTHTIDATLQPKNNIATKSITLEVENQNKNPNLQKVRLYISKELAS